MLRIAHSVNYSYLPPCQYGVFVARVCGCVMCVCVGGGGDEGMGCVYECVIVYK